MEEFREKNIVSPKMPRSGAPALFIISVYKLSITPDNSQLTFHELIHLSCSKQLNKTQNFRKVIFVTSALFISGTHNVPGLKFKGG